MLDVILPTNCLLRPWPSSACHDSQVMVSCVHLVMHISCRLTLVQVTIDNSTTSAYSLINIVCRDRKGLVYDVMRTVKDIHIRVAYGKVHVRQDYMCEADLFVQEVDGQQITDQ